MSSEWTAESLIDYNFQREHAVFTTQNHIQIFTDGAELFHDMITEFKHAKHYIHIQSYILRDGDLLQSLLPLFRMKTEEGVSIRILYDGIGSLFLSRQLKQQLRDIGVHTAVFFSGSDRRHLSFNYRNHRKITIVDGNYGYLGGFNFGDEYIGTTEDYGYWRDTHLKITGEAVDDLHLQFLKDWKELTHENLRSNRFHHENWQPPACDNPIGMQIISSGPADGCGHIKDNFLQLISHAKHYIDIQTPYLIPDQKVLEALKSAAASGIKVSVMLPARADHSLVYWGTFSFAGELLESGIKFFFYTPGFMHAKGLIIDDSIATYGTTNMDYRSFFLNYEVNAVIYNSEVAKKLREIFDTDCLSCHELTLKEYLHRPLLTKIKERGSRLLSPLL